jgi:hypothetical protein
MDLGHVAPHLFLDSDKNPTRFVSEYYEAQSLKLEGDFANHFTLYAPPNYQVDALQLFTPDVMAAFMDYGIEFDFEIVGHSLYVFLFDGDILANDKLESLLEGLQQIHRELKKQLGVYHDVKAKGARLPVRELRMYVRGKTVDIIECSTVTAKVMAVCIAMAICGISLLMLVATIAVSVKYGLPWDFHPGGL